MSEGRARVGGVLGVVHLQPLPGDPRSDGSGWADVLRRAVEDAEALLEGGVDGLIVENFGSVPFVKGTAGDRLPPHAVAFMTRVASAVRMMTTRPLGLNCLRNDAQAAIGIAAATGADFVRINVHVGAYVTDQGIIEGEAGATLRYRDAIGARSVSVVADVLVKHAAPLAPLGVDVAVRDTFDRGLADAVVVTGTGTGQPVSRELLGSVRKVAGERSVLIGSGFTPGDVDALAPLAHGAIVGTYFKRGGDVAAPVELERVRRLCEAARGRFREAISASA